MIYSSSLRRSPTVCRRQSPTVTDHMETLLCGIDSQTSQIIWEPDLNILAKSVNPWVQRGIEGLKANILPAAFFHDKNNAVYFSLPCKFKLSLRFQCALTRQYLFALPFSSFYSNKKINKKTIFHCWLVCLNCESNMKRNIDVYINGNA